MTRRLSDSTRPLEPNSRQFTATPQISAANPARKSDTDLCLLRSRNSSASTNNIQSVLHRATASRYAAICGDERSVLRQSKHVTMPSAASPERSFSEPSEQSLQYTKI